MKSFFTLASLIVLTCGCGSPAREQAATPASGARTPTAATPPATPAVPAEIARCTLGPTHVVTQNRRRPEIVVGASSIAIVHKSRRPVSIIDAQCDPSRIVQTSPWPIAGTFATTSITPPCAGTEGEESYNPEAVIFADAARDGGDVFVIQCRASAGGGYNDEEAHVLCELSKGGPTPRVGLITADTTVFAVESVRAGFSIARAGSTQVFTIALAGTDEGDGVYGLLLNGSRSVPTGKMGRPPTAMDLDDPRHFSMTVTPTPDGGFVFEQGASATTQRVRTTFGANLERVGFPSPVTITAPPAREFDFMSERAERSAPLAIRFMKSGVASPVTGLSTTIATFGSDFVKVRERIVLVWSEGTGTTTHIRAAIVDPSTSAIVGDIIEVSTAGREAGYATIDAHEGHAAIAWDEKDGDRWEVRAASLDCR